MSSSRFRTNLRGPSDFEPANPGSPYDAMRGIESSSPPPFEMHTRGSTVNGVVIGLLSSFGSAIFLALIFIVVYFFKYTAGGRILLDRLGRPGEYDDEQAFLREEAAALEEMDDLQRTEYLRAKGRRGPGPPPLSVCVCSCASWRPRAQTCVCVHSVLTGVCLCSVYPSKPAGLLADGYISVTILGNSRKGSFGMGVRAGVGDCKLFC